MAVTGPFTDTISGGGNRPGNYYRTKTGYRQSPPFTKVLAYQLTQKECLSARNWGVVTKDPDGNCYEWNVSSDPSPFYLHAPIPSWNGEYYPYARAYGKLMSEINKQAALAVDFAERSKTAQMMRSRVGSLVSFVKALKRFDFRTCADVLGLSKSQRRRARSEYPDAWSRAKAEAGGLSDLFLEWSFGWKPLFEDIFRNVPEVLAKDFAPMRVRASASTLYRYKAKVDNGGWVTGGDYVGNCRVAMGCVVKVSNANVYAAARLGLTNPLAVAWEVVPFSFILDYWVSVGDFLGSFSDSHGLLITEPWTSRKSNVGGSSFLWNSALDPSYGGFEMSSTTRYFSRTLGLVGPSVQFKGVHRYLFSSNSDAAVHRLSTSVAILLQQLASLR